MKLAVTGFVSEAAGSIASANALLLRSLLTRGWEVDFFSKSTFVDPRPSVGPYPNFRFVDVRNSAADHLRQRLSPVPLAGFLAARADSFTYNRLLVSEIARAHRERSYDLCLWLGDYARGRVSALPNCSFAQGPPGTDARSVLRHYPLIRRLAGPWAAARLRLLAKIRLSRAGLPPFHHSDHIIVGSTQSRKTLADLYNFHKTSSLPYPIDLDLFRPGTKRRSRSVFRCLWLGRIVPRKRLDLFLDAADMLICSGRDIELIIVGTPALVPQLGCLIEAFPHHGRLRWIKSLPRDQVPSLMADSDVLIQPSEEEDFGSSVAEAQACGLPVIVGKTNGNRDYLSPRDICLPEDSTEGLVLAIKTLANQNAKTDEGTSLSRGTAEKYFDKNTIGEQLALTLRHCLKTAIQS